MPIAAKIFSIRMAVTIDNFGRAELAGVEFDVEDVILSV